MSAVDEHVDSEVTTVAVMGSCISRDNFNSLLNPGYKQFYTCPLIQNQTSVISLMSEPVDTEVRPVESMSDYDQWNVRTDLNKEFLRGVVELAPDYVILDFFADVHFGVVELADGRFITNNHWKLWRTTYWRELQEAGGSTALSFAEAPERYLQLWTDAFERLTAYLRRELPETKVVVHRGHYTGSVIREGSERPVPINRGRRQKVDVDRANELWGMLDDLACKAGGFEVIDLTGGYYPSFDEHPWGPFYVHYSLDYYHQFLAELHKIYLRQSLDEVSWARIGAIETAVIDRVSQLQARVHELEARIERQQAKIKRQRERINALKAASVSRRVSLAAALRSRARRFVRIHRT